MDFFFFQYEMRAHLHSKFERSNFTPPVFYSNAPNRAERGKRRLNIPKFRPDVVARDDRHMLVV